MTYEIEGVLITRWSIQAANGLLFPLQEGDEVLLDDGHGQMRLTTVTYRRGANVAGIFVPGDFSTDGIPLRRGLRAAIGVKTPKPRRSAEGR